MATINYDLLEFHVCEASQELDLLLDSIRHARNEPGDASSAGNEPLYSPLHESALAASLEHAYHHLNFAWNARFRTMGGSGRAIFKKREISAARKNIRLVCKVLAKIDYQEKHKKELR